MDSHGKKGLKDLPEGDPYYFYDDDSEARQNYWHRLEKRILHLRWFLFIFFIFRLLLALFTFGICMWIRFELDFREWVQKLGWYTYWYCMYVTMTAMIGEAALSFFTIYAVLYQDIRRLKAIVVSVALLIPIEITGTVLIIVYGMETSQILTSQLYDVFIGFVHLWDIDPAAKSALKQIMEYVGCCGADGSDDFIGALKPVPYECRDPITGMEWGYGCMQQMAWYLEPWTAILASSNLFYCVSDILAIWAIWKLRHALQQVSNEQEGDEDQDEDEEDEGY